MPPTTAEQAARMRRPTTAEAEGLVIRSEDLPPRGEVLLIGPGAALDWPHGFTLARQVLQAGEVELPHRRAGPEVLLIQSGTLELDWGSGPVRLGPGDTATVPAGATRTRRSDEGAVVFLVRGGDAAPGASKA